MTIWQRLTAGRRQRKAEHEGIAVDYEATVARLLRTERARAAFLRALAPEPLLGFYVDLVLTKGIECTGEDIYYAYCESVGEDDPLPYHLVDPIIRAYDVPFYRAVQQAALSLARGEATGQV